MSNSDSWHSQDAFWELFESILFNSQRLASARDEVDRIVRLLGLDGPARILDLCCGIGRHSLELAQRGFDVTGVDRTARYIERARLEAAQRSLPAAFLVDDMRTFRAPDSFDVILNLFGSFGYFEKPDDDRQVISNMVASLRAGGRLLIETAGKEIVARNFQAREWNESDDVLVLAERKPSDHWSRMETRWIIIQGTQRAEQRVSVRCYSAFELSSLLVEGGLSNVRVFGSLSGAPYDERAERLVLTGEK